MPQKWKNVTIIVIHKKTDKAECGNYRGTSLVAHAGKVLLNNISRRLSDNFEMKEVLLDKQCGFLQRSSTVDMLFVVRRLQGLGQRQGIPLYTCFINLIK